MALGDGKFDVYFLTGGLPGAGWDTKGRIKVPGHDRGRQGRGRRQAGWTGSIAAGSDRSRTEGGDAFTLKHVDRKSPTLDAKPPEGAMILFDGSSAEWARGKIVEKKLLFRGVTSKKPFGPGKLHVEFRTPFQPKAGGQGRGNSGVYVQGQEVQVLD